MKKFYIFILLTLFLGLEVKADVNATTQFGAVGDRLFLKGVTTVSGSGNIIALQSAVYTNGPYSTTAFVAGDVGKTLEVFGAGVNRGAVTNEDLAGIITAVTDATHCTINKNAGYSGANQVGLYGTNNVYAISNAIVLGCKAPGNTNLVFETGHYFIADPALINGTFPGNSVDNLYGAYSSFNILRGGIRFVGNGGDPTNTSLDFNQAWMQRNGACYRGVGIFLIGGMTNRLALEFTNLTIAGAMPLGFSGNHGGGNGPADPQTGFGCDVTASFLVEGLFNLGDVVTNIIFNHCIVSDNSGEMFKRSGFIPYQLLSSTNSQYYSGNLTVFNNFAVCLDNVTASNNIEFMENDLSGLLSNSIVVNCRILGSGRGVAGLGALIGTVYPNQLYSNDFFNCATYGYAAYSTRNLTMVSNHFEPFTGSSLTAFSSSYAGSQGNDDNSNIVFYGNSLTNCTGPDLSRDVRSPFAVTNNYGNINNGGHYIFVGSTYLYTLGNLKLANNTFYTLFEWNDFFPQVGYPTFFPLDETNNTIGILNGSTGDTATAGQTNAINYYRGYNHIITASTATSGFYPFRSTQNPTNAVIKLKNSGGVSTTVKFGASESSNMQLADGATQFFFWDSGNQYWLTNAPAPPPPPPTVFYMFRR